MEGYKIFTHDLRSPFFIGEPVFEDGKLPYMLPEVEVDKTDTHCGKGWNFCVRSADALRIGGMWPNGYPSRLFRVESIGEVVERGDKCRASELRILEEVTDIGPVIRELSKVFGEVYREDMVREQMLWREALGRPLRDEKVVEAGLRKSLEIRGLDWSLRRFGSVEDAWAASAAMDVSAAWYAIDAWSANAAWNAWDAWNANAAGPAWVAWADWNAWSARCAGPAWSAWSAWGGLPVYYSSKRGWADFDPYMLTEGLRDAYRHGLGIAVPTGEKELGWAMV
jgi:hypothetical protein